MAHYTQTATERRFTLGPRTVLLAWADWLLEALHSMAERRRVRRTVFALRSLENHALKDIGIDRSEIMSVALAAADDGSRWRHVED